MKNNVYNLPIIPVHKTNNTVRPCRGSFSIISGRLERNGLFEIISLFCFGCQGNGGHICATDTRVELHSFHLV